MHKIVSHIGLNPEIQQQMMSGAIEVELVPQGTLIERIRAGLRARWRPDADRRRHRGQGGQAQDRAGGAGVHKIVSHIGLNPEIQQQMMSGAIEVGLVPQER